MNIIRNGTWLDQQAFPEPAWIVPGILPEGCSILTGRPKMGKSFLVLSIALAAATGGEVMGLSVDQRPVLYLALEDDDRRIQERGRKLGNDAPLPADFYYLTRTAPEPALDAARDWMSDHRDSGPLIIVDTLEKIRPKRSGNAYGDDYKAGTELQTLLASGGGVIAVHHNRKNDSSDDFLDDVSGTLGLTGSVDTILNLKRQRNGHEGTLSITGRDVDEMIYAVRFCENGKWEAGGTDLAEAARKVTELGLSTQMLSVVAAIEQIEEASAKDIAVLCAIPEPTARKYLSRLCERGLIVRLMPGRYGPVTASQVSREDLATPVDEVDNAEAA